jgi:SAM-dependent methyltransferase
LDLVSFALKYLPPPPARVLEVGCGAGELALALDAAGYEVVAIDPDAPQGRIFRQLTLEELDDPGSFHAAVAARVLHHVEPLEPAVAKLAGLATTLILDEFASERVDGRASAWWDRHRRTLRDPAGPPELHAWRLEHPDLHPSAKVLAVARRHYTERYFEWRPYLYRWLKNPQSEEVERAAIAAGELRALGYRWVGRVP